MLPLLALSLTLATTTHQESADPYANETVAQRDVRMKWFREARFGMFIHWGVYSVPAGTYDGTRIPSIGEWIMHEGKIPTARYQQYAKEFNPVNYDADKWVKVAKEAGMKYIVITSKHHDGFAMFDSKASPWNIVKASPFGRDPLKELSAACRKYGIRLGFYYSQAQDWNNPGGAAAGGHWDPAQNGDMTEYIKRVAVPQLKEILSNYGPVACLWWDTPYDMTKERADLLLPVLKLQPGIIYNNRLGGGYKGDTETPEQYIPATGFPGRDWETCMTMNDTWGYKSYDQNWKSSTTIIRNLVDIASKGGNYLLNVGPTNLGEIPGPSVERLKTVGAWMSQNSKAIYATSASPFKKLSWGRCTKVVNKSGATLYLHVFDWPTDGKLVVPGLKNNVSGATLLASGGKLGVRNTSDGVVIDVPGAAPDKVSSTIVLKVNGPLIVEEPLISQNADGSLKLNAGDAVLHGGDIQTEGSGDKTNIGFWTNPADWVEWQLKGLRPGKYSVSFDLAAPTTTELELSVDGKKLGVHVPNTGSYTNFKVVEVGSIDIPGGTSVTLRAVSKGWQPFNLRSVSIRPTQ